MGWLYYAKTKQHLINDRIMPVTSEHYCSKVLLHYVDSDVLWKLVHLTVAQDDLYPGLKSGESTRIISCDLLSCYSFQWGYKALDESSHPFYYSCPLTFLEMAPVTNEQWRQGVREYHRMKRTI